MKNYKLATIDDSAKVIKEIDRNIKTDLNWAISLYKRANKLEPATTAMRKINTGISQWVNARQKYINQSYTLIKCKLDLDTLNSILEMSDELKELYTKYRELIANRNKLRSDEKYKKSKIKKTVNTLDIVKDNIDKLNVSFVVSLYLTNADLNHILGVSYFSATFIEFKSLLIIFNN